MKVAIRTVDGFDLIDLIETGTSMVRDPGQVRLTWTNESSQLEQLVKTEAAVTGIGSLLVSKGNCLLPTGDRQSSRTVAKLLAGPEQAVRTKEVVIDGTTFTARLLPVQLL